MVFVLCCAEVLFVRCVVLVADYSLCVARLSLFVGLCLLFIVCWLLACCLLVADCRVEFVTRLWCAVCIGLFAICCVVMLCIVCCLLLVCILLVDR